MSCDVGEVTESLENEHCSTAYSTVYSSAHSPTFLSLHLCPAHSPSLPSLYLRHSSFSNPSFASPTSQALHLHHLVSSAQSPTFLSLRLCHSSFSKPSVAFPMSQLILQPFFCFSYITDSSLTSPGELPMEIWIVIKIKLVVTPQWNKPLLSLSQK